ncbi:hypothetical protein ACX8XN_13655 [Calditrichota bacterium GD2]
MPEKLLQEIKEIDSVEAVAVISFKGNIWQQTGATVTAEQMKMIGSYLLRMLAIKSKSKQRIVHIELHWLNRFLIARFSEGFLLVTLFKKADILSLLRITLNVTVANLLEEKTFLKWLKKEKYNLNLHIQKGQFDEHELGLISKLV